jgi:hypothetical protein
MMVCHLLVFYLHAFYHHDGDVVNVLVLYELYVF